MNKDFKVGIVDYTVYTPEAIITAEELSPLVNIPANILREKMGINQKHVAGPDDHPGIMATKCVKELLEKTGQDPLGIDMILYAGETYCEYTCWTVAIKIQNEIGADNCYAWDLSFRCAGSPLALKVAKDMMYADDKLNTVVVCGGNFNSNLIDYQKPEQSFMFNMSPGGFAVMLKRDHFENELLGSGIITDHVFCMDVIGDTGGTLNPLTPEMLSDPEAIRTFPLLTVTDPQGMKKRLAERSLVDFTGAVRIAAENSNIKTSDIDFLGCVHINPRAHYAILADLGIDKENTVYLSDDGHCGHADPFIAHKHAIERNIVKDGSLCAWLAAGTGYAFACSIIRWGKIK